MCSQGFDQRDSAPFLWSTIAQCRKVVKQMAEIIWTIPLSLWMKLCKSMRANIDFEVEQIRSDFEKVKISLVNIAPF